VSEKKKWILKYDNIGIEPSGSHLFFSSNLQNNNWDFSVPFVRYAPRWFKNASRNYTNYSFFLQIPKSITQFPHKALDTFASFLYRKAIKELARVATGYSISHFSFQNSSQNQSTINGENKEFRSKKIWWRVWKDISAPHRCSATTTLTWEASYGFREEAGWREQSRPSVGLKRRPGLESNYIGIN